MITDVKYMHLISKYVSKPFTFLKQRTLAISPGIPHFDIFILGTVFDQMAFERIATFQKCKVLAYLR